MKKYGVVIAILLGVLFLAELLPLGSSSGAIVLVGGGQIPVEAIVWLKDRAKTRNYVVITCDLEYGLRWTELLGDNVELVLPENFSSLPLFNVGAIVIDGGDQWEYVNRLSGRAIQAAHEIGIPILGTSAGAMILGEHYFSAERGSISSEEIEQEKDKVCLGKRFVTIQCLKGLIVDTHFSERDRNGRLKVFIEKSGAQRGLGIDEETALCIDNKNAWVVGKGGVKVLQNQNYVNRR